MICFDLLDNNECQVFDERTVKTVDKTNKPHNYGELALYKGHVLAIGGWDANGTVEEFTENGWTVSSHLKHPR